MNNELKQIKKIYGEDMMHLCRSIFPNVLEKEGKLLEILQDNIAPTRSLAKEIIENNLISSFRNWINSLVEEDITHGLKIVGTGTIDYDGNVGSIGGVEYNIKLTKYN